MAEILHDGVEPCAKRT